MGVMHGDEVAYVFGQPLNMSYQYNARERDLSLRIMKAFSRFALTGLVLLFSILYIDASISENTSTRPLPLCSAGGHWLVFSLFK